MNCAEVCIDIDTGGDGNEFFRRSTPIARKEWKCDECLETINPGAWYERSTGKSDGQFWSIATCQICVEIREAFVCGSFVFGMLWESIEEEMWPIWKTKGPIDCLAKIESRAARDYIQERYAEYRKEMREEI